MEGDLDMAQGKSEEALEAYEKAREMGQKDAALFAHIQELKNSTVPQDESAQERPEPAIASTAEGYHHQIELAENRGNLDDAFGPGP